MDYPAPLVKIHGNRLDLSDAYGRGIGVYDKHAVRWLYSDFPPGTDEKAALEAIVREGLDRGLRFMDYVDNAFVGASHRYASVWDNGSDPVDGLAHTLEVRRIALESFGPQAVRAGDPLATLEKVLVPLYLHHRFQLGAALQSLGGADYTYAARGDGQVPLTPVPGSVQRRALDLALQTLSPDFLLLPDAVLEQLPPKPPMAPGFESLPGHTGLLFDPRAAATTAADMTVQALLHPARLARIHEFGSRSDGPDVAEVADRLIAATWGAPTPDEARAADVLQAVQRVTLDRLLEQAADHPVSGVRAVLTDRVLCLADTLERKSGADSHEALAAADIRRWQARQATLTPPPAPPDAPPGSPIGQGW
jgi:hypothetical protein